MSYLDRLLEGIDIDLKSFGEICDLVTDYVAAGSFASVRENVKYNSALDYAQLIRTKDIKNNFQNKDFVYVSENAFKFLWRVNLNKEFLVLPNIGNCGEVYHITPDSLPHKNNVLGPNAILARSSTQNNRFLYYLIQSPGFQSQLTKITSPLGQSKFNKTDLKKLQIPIPPLSVQKEIVRILDTFTKLTEELTLELGNENIARDKQYRFYREQLFSFDKVDVERKALKEIGEFQRGKRFIKDDMIPEGVPCIHYGEMYTYYGVWAKETKSFLSKELVENKNLRVAESGDVVIVAAGETIEDIGMGTAWLGDEGVVIHDACFSFRSPLNPKFVAYFTRTKQFHDQIKKHISSGKISAINARGLEKVLIPVPSPEEQERIVNILDKFDILTTSISEGLPKEIELRKKQYEYYRDLLLTFPNNNIA